MSRGKASLAFRAELSDQNSKEFQFQNFNLKTSSAMVLEGLR